MGKGGFQTACLKLDSGVEFTHSEDAAIDEVPPCSLVFPSAYRLFS